MRDIKEILAACDHTLLKQEATPDQIIELLDDAIKYSTASICIPPCYIETASKHAHGKMKICTVIGFPNGNMTTDSKVFETQDALKKGADEIDMVINIGMLKAGKNEYVKNEIIRINDACKSFRDDIILKVIIETCLLTDDEKKKMCEIVTESKADFIKTSTGFSTAGATFADIELFAKYVGKDVKIKAAGGISSIEDADRFLDLGASRLGTSRVVKIVKESKLL
ncbi:MAG: deoxyribose-phosphate aldolase [Lachnospiraceae bacterium]|nr:deoxyribose-phosphate aldolase [Lachnospiraceae bacterium]